MLAEISSCSLNRCTQPLKKDEVTAACDEVMMAIMEARQQRELAKQEAEEQHGSGPIISFIPLECVRPLSSFSLGRWYGRDRVLVRCC